MGKITRMQKFDTGTESLYVQQDLGNRKKLHIKDLLPVSPKHGNQELFMAACFSNSPMVIAAGSAGSGKSFIGLYAALHQVLDSSTPYQQVVVVRSAVATRDLGHMPGDLHEKEAVFEAPYIGLTKELFPKFNSPYNHLKSLGYYDFKSTSYIRGTTLHDTIVIVDEFQNLNKHEIYTLLTRLGINSKIILCGDTKQSDLKSSQSGFEYLIQLCKNMNSEDSQLIEFNTDDIVRSDFVKSVIIADEMI